MKLGNLKVGLRLGVAFGSILCITVAIVLYAQSRISALHQSAQRLATAEMEQQALVEEWATSIQLNWVRTEAALRPSTAATSINLRPPWRDRQSGGADTAAHQSTARPGAPGPGAA